MLKLHRELEEEIGTAVPGNAKILVLDLVKFELERLARKASSNTEAFARPSLEFLDKRELSVLEHKPGPTDVDAALIACALTEKTLTGIATVDRALRLALASQNVPVIYPKARRGLVAERFHF